MELQTVPGSNGRLLCNGWWALSRHVNYCGEIVQALALALPGYLATRSLLPFLYPVYYLALFIPRELDDEKICAEKYGEAWADYKRRVPYRIFPGLY
jgi:protein-S-isoprenylcysteine O-methyltransferase Ste14